MAVNAPSTRDTAVVLYACAPASTSWCWWQRLVRLCAGVDELVLVTGLSVGAPGYGPLPMLQPMDIATTQRTARLLRGKVDLG
jgi:hypothetical protein